jgi:hypothetical protein
VEDSAGNCPYRGRPQRRYDPVKVNSLPGQQIINQREILALDEIEYHLNFTLQCGRDYSPKKASCESLDRRRNSNGFVI